MNVDYNLRWMEWKLREAEYRISRLQTRYTGLEQNLMWLQPPNNRCSTTISGKIVGGLFGLNTALPGSTIQVIGHVTSEDYGTYTATDGTYSIGIDLDPADTSLDLVVTGPGSRFAPSSPVNRSITPCSGSNTLTNILATPAIGYRYWGDGTTSGGGWCLYPIKESLDYDDTAGGGFFGTGTFPWDSVNKRYGTLNQSRTSRTGVTCPSATVDTQLYVPDLSGSWNVSMPYRAGTVVSPTSSCPAMPGTQNVGMVGGFFPYITTSYSITCPDGGSTGFSFTFHWTVPGTSANHPWFPPGAYSITFTETP